MVGANYAHSLKLLEDFKARHPEVPTKSGLMVGLGETDEEIPQTLRYVPPDTFAMYGREAAAMGFSNAACAPLVRSSYHADMQAHEAGVA